MSKFKIGDTVQIVRIAYNVSRYRMLIGKLGKIEDIYSGEYGITVRLPYFDGAEALLEMDDDGNTGTLLFAESELVPVRTQEDYMQIFNYKKEAE